MNIALIAPAALGAAAGTLALRRVVERLQLSLAKHRSLTGHARMARRVARMVPFYEYDDASFFASDGAPGEVAELRRRGFMALAEHAASHFAQTRAATDRAESSISDLQFTGNYRVPFQYRRLVREHLRSGAFVASSAGVQV